MVYAPEHHRADSSGCVYEHIIVAEQILGRPLTDEEVVHHIDHNRSNNSIDNLMVFHSAKDHSMFHYGAEIYQVDNIWYAIPVDNIKKCEFCGKEFVAKYKTQTFCSNSCARKTQPKKIPYSLNNEIVDNIKRLKGNITQVARMYDVSFSTIKKRLKSLGLPYHSKDYQ